MVRGKFSIAAVIGFMTLLISSHVFAQAEVIETRQDAMKGNSANAKAIKAAIESKDYATIETKAKAEIWEKPDDFAKAAKNLGKAASELAAAAKAKDDAEIGVKVKALGDACGSCHKAFRAEKYPE